MTEKHPQQRDGELNGATPVQSRTEEAQRTFQSSATGRRQLPGRGNTSGYSRHTHARHLPVQLFDETTACETANGTDAIRRDG